MATIVIRARQASGHPAVIGGLILFVLWLGAILPAGTLWAGFLE